jgi:enamine deaminase RidA (YjgF/YER057c/UK114 family)
MTTAVTLIRAPQLAQAPYAHAATIAVDARLLFLAGSCPLAADGTVVPGGIAAQTARALDNLETALLAAGATLTDVVATRVLVASTERSELVEAWTVVHDRFGAHDVPSTLIGVTVLGYPGQLVEIEATAGVVE